MAVAVRGDVISGGATTVTSKLPVAVFAVRELIALNLRVKVPLMLAPGVRVITPVAELMEAQAGSDVAPKEFAPWLLRIWWVLVDPAFIVSVVSLVICPTPPESLPRMKVSEEERYWPRSMSASLVERLKEDVYCPSAPAAVLKIPARSLPVGPFIEESFILNMASWSAAPVVAAL